MRIVHSMIIVRVNLTENNTWPFYCQYCTCYEERHGLHTDCSYKELFMPPREIDTNTSTLLLQGNYIKVLQGVYFAGLTNLRILDLSLNKIDHIEVATFQDLTALDILYLNGNDFSPVIQAVIRVGVFVGLENLSILTLQDSMKFWDAKVPIVPAAALMDLRWLKKLSMDGPVAATFGDEFRNLTQLSSLTMSGTDGVCRIGSLTKDSFAGLPHLESLTLSSCQLKSIESDTFSYLPRLSYLNLSWNIDIEFERFGQIAYGLTFTNLTTLDISAIHNPDVAGTQITCPNVRYLRQLHLKELFMDDNGIDFIDYGVFSLLPNTIKKIYMRRNRLLFGLLMYEVVFSNPGLELFDAGDQRTAKRSHKKDTTKSNRSKKKEYPKRIGRNVLKSRVDTDTGNNVLKERSERSSAADDTVVLELKMLICSGSMYDMNLLDFSNTINNITYVDLSTNFIPHIKYGSFHGLGALEYLKLSYNNMEQIDVGGFEGMEALTALDLNGNFLGHALAIDKEGELFSDLTNIHKIHLSMNRISKINKDVFRALHHLRSLDLHGNYIENLDLNLASLPNLQNLNVSDNRIQSIPQDIRDVLSRTAKRHQVLLDLTNNILACNCDTIPFLQWLRLSPVTPVNIDNYNCTLTNGSVRYLNESTFLIKTLEEECQSYLGISIGCSIGFSFLVACVLSYSVYRNRWKFRYMYYMAKVKLDRNNNADNQDLRFDYDVFLSYGDGDRPFVVNSICDNLEKNEGLRLNIRDRDFEIGEAIVVNISKAIRTSKKTILLLSRHFLQNKWCNFEMNMARMESLHTNRNVLIIVFLEVIPAGALPLEILDILRESPYIDLPLDEHLRPAFWQKCVEYVND